MIFFRSALVASAAAVFAASAANATVVINDQTDDIAYRGHSPNHYFGSSTQGDVIGNGFDTKSVSVDITGNTITLKYYTQFDGNALGAHYADVFITSSNSSTAPSSWAYGISLGYQTSHGGVAPGLYAISPGDFETSQDIWASRTDYIYGGLYIAPGEIAQHVVPTRVTGGLLQTDWVVDAHKNGAHEVDITLTAATAAALSLLDGDYLDILWGTGDCANDTIFAQVERPHDVPEPASAVLLAGGLFGLRRRVLKKSR